MLKVKDVYEKVLKEVTCNLRKVLNESVKSIKKVLKVLESVRKSQSAEIPHHAEARVEYNNRPDQSTINICNFIIQIK